MSLQRRPRETTSAPPPCEAQREDGPVRQRKGVSAGPGPAATSIWDVQSPELRREVTSVFCTLLSQKDWDIHLITSPELQTLSRQGQELLPMNSGGWGGRPNSVCSSREQRLPFDVFSAHTRLFWPLPWP